MTPATVVICTHNRADLLGRAVAAAHAEAEACGAEVLVVDNASTDATARVVTDLMRTYPRLRLAHEPALGLSAARNRGLAEARGPVAVYLDDDAVPRPGWLAALLAPYAEPAVACTGGRILLRFSTPPPPWLDAELASALSAYDLGDAPRRLRWRPGDTFPFGANISFRVEAARALGGFSTTVGPRGARLLVHDETDLCYRLDRTGAEIRYCPGAVVDHCILTERLTPAWMLARHRERGESAAVFELRNRGPHRALGRVRWYYGAHLMALPYTPSPPVDAGRLVRECRRQEALGYVAGLACGLVRLRALRRDMALSGAPA
ncbi:MAG TPA: glycosyltransferase [Candidatus Binatia bacterium]|nr:glycosyltransferase [Candidatus Binatia bacterium]